MHEEDVRSRTLLTDEAAHPAGFEAAAGGCVDLEQLRDVGPHGEDHYRTVGEKPPLPANLRRGGC